MLAIALLFLSFLASLSLTSQLARAQDEIPGTLAGLSPEEVEKTQEKIEGKWDYLSREWKSIFLKNKLVSAIDGFFTKISFVFKGIIGIEYSMSFIFLFGVIIWITIFIVLFNPVSVMFKNKLVALPVSFIVASLIGISGVIRMAASSIVNLIKTPMIFWIAFVLTIIAAIFMVICSKILKGKINIENKADEKESMRRRLEKAAAYGDILSKGMEDVVKKG